LKIAKAEIKSNKITLKDLLERFKIWLNEAWGVPTSRSFGAAALLAALLMIIFFLGTTPGNPMPTYLTTGLFALTGLAGTIYATGEGKTFSGPVGIARTIIVLMCFVILFMGPSLGERPILFEMIAVAFGRSLKE